MRFTLPLRLLCAALIGSPPGMIITRFHFWSQYRRTCARMRTRSDLLSRIKGIPTTVLLAVCEQLFQLSRILKGTRTAFHVQLFHITTYVRGIEVQIGKS